MLYVWYPAPVTSHARAGASAANRPERFPVVLFSHGHGTSSSSYTSLIEHLVSWGYVVVAVEHPYSSASVVFPDGRVIRATERRRREPPSTASYFERVEMAMTDMRQLNEVQASDLIFVLDQLATINSSGRPSLLSGRLDASRVGAMGHSLGGMTAVRACQRDAISVTRAFFDKYLKGEPAQLLERASDRDLEVTNYPR